MYLITVNGKYSARSKFLQDKTGRQMVGQTKNVPPIIEPEGTKLGNT